MTGTVMTVFGSVVILLTLAYYRYFGEQNLRGLTDVEKLTWLDSFSTQRIIATSFPVAVALISVLVTWFWPASVGWSIVIASTCLLVFSLMWQYMLYRQIIHFRFNKRFVQQTLWLMITTQASLIIGVGLLAFGVAGTRL